ncbi:LytS/YhcK type 5TM receptor domain-containing protein [Pseudodesulfovibrio thermohalotolerans]|uniref:LytS/YhcK type 5TM receptor domain-containing protein n=1 Tax=Pseudodesulfovibrio thermohalotolerans TaxID=2880651 RepID=UPI0024433C0A|nr:LytS/YhcK type 5TM receptor domain-containing protein [Pseudodesulfovibrio thermohalotolerans]WFS62060.1 LytS/YhcK type 5TM receptor domain-containing protein [Pseudodesulfovibrio thermohalotolerans]
MNTFEIILILAERFGLMVGVVLLFLTIMPVRHMQFTGGSSRLRTVLVTVLFGLLGILGTYTGNAVFDSVANLRAMVVISGGLFGGPVVGIGAGLIAGVHRIAFDLHGFSAYPCGIATALEGFAAGMVAWRYGAAALNWRAASVLALAGEAMHMGLLLLMSRPFPEAWELVKLIAPPMLLVNAFGAALFVEVINLFSRDRDRRESLHAQIILDIANMAVSYLRMGLSPETAAATAEIIFTRVGVAAVAITDTRDVLAHVGAGADHHLPGREIRTTATREVVRTGRPTFLHSAEAIGCNQADCPMTSAIIVPLKKNDEIVGTLKFYGSRERPLNATLFEVANGLANLFSTQVELEDIQIKEQMLAHAEIRRLHAQINPHFLFNSLNTIASFCRTNSERARDLLMDLSLYMRRNLDLSRGFIPLSEELEQVRSYLAIEKARFGDRIQVEAEVEDGCGNWPIPPLIIQPLVENAIRHGVLGRERGGMVRVSARRENGHLEIRVADDGVGMDRATLDRVLNPECADSATGGIGMRNCLSRMEHIYGRQFAPKVDSVPGKGTTIVLQVPDRR